MQSSDRYRKQTNRSRNGSLKLNKTHAFEHRDFTSQVDQNDVEKSISIEKI